MSRLLLTLLRVTLSLWVGGAILYVITSVAEQRYTAFDSSIRDQLAAIRFPLYYVYCWLTLGTSCLTAVILLTITQPRSGTLLLVTTLCCASMAFAIYDYYRIYQPLLQLITPPGKARNQDFMRLHELSRHINELHLSLAAIAAIVASASTLQAGQNSRSLENTP